MPPGSSWRAVAAHLPTIGPTDLELQKNFLQSDTLHDSVALFI